ncbi:hypothetical protein BVE84_06205 [Streptococcus azizii]|uniref:UPF0223 protein BVE84_06205 n=1 Tax=Streptococcus azizii TaxID=1579424 RepID=A0AB36JQS1_9STRE|nr:MULTISPECIES: UPF0223 family protein [Streptococcus]MBF0776182.1 UPF0223 family protein [Streptococcus sp. 19428wD3_AN2]ONK26955.1 hypothetical protein BVE86_06400 [Streptococcus azizii]ONK27977.1 hypothetical protein BVE85_05755 [Streptococcus azizii]ONK28821.1 hypothetical protein BVE84_06205 [Streptococcus azizii]TFU83526.1 UPF0223 family protein [Streptococcus sp. AN2]
MEKNYLYPLDFSWSTEEISSVLSFLNQVEKAYEGGVTVSALLEAYDQFKMVVKSKGEERRIGREFEAVSGYSIYQALKQAKDQGKGVISLGR